MNLINKKEDKNKNVNINTSKNLILVDSELNTLSYENALKIDKRTYMQYYISLLKTKHLIIFTFFPMKDYNSMIIKICLFIFYMNMLFTVNALFFNDNTFIKINEDEGSFNIIYQLPQIIYSSLISNIIYYLIKFLSLTERYIIQIKNGNYELSSKPKIIKNVNIRFFFFCLISFICLVLFVFYIGCFCSVYKNTQMQVIKDTLIGFVTSLLYTLGLNLLPGIFRIPALKSKNRECIFILSKFLQLI